jgi:hypothetical protein
LRAGVTPVPARSAKIASSISTATIIALSVTRQPVGAWIQKWMTYVDTSS